ncbi:hypothetical protein DY218_27270 [Streptomyces triticagri]|uniref:Uncharacterized protein n=1 Tax=Streptomyces triticagri TaxID=2293568 RepID=A0A372LYA6_9ACTN|nr:hypothetical protein [Streptomyces triticagri]RFU83611.1 hypothetical protein DY218_27270 [Streptomyces triticagri]
MKNVILDTDDLRQARSESAGQIRLDGELYDIKRPKRAAGISISRLAQHASDDPDEGEALVRKLLQSFLIDRQDVDYLTDRILDLDDDLDLDVISSIIARIQEHFDEQDKDTGAAPSARARAVRPPSDRPKPRAKKRTAAPRAAKPAEGSKTAKSA